MSYFRMNAEIEFLGNPEFNLSFGGFTLTSLEGKTYTFDFLDTEQSYIETLHKGQPKTIISLLCKHPDYDYANTKDITEDFIKDVENIDDFYIDYEGLNYQDEVSLLKINSINFEFLNKTKDKYATIPIRNSVIKKYNNNLTKEKETLIEKDDYFEERE